MPLPPSPKREKIHSRRIVCEGFRRDDGLIEVDGHIVDQRPFPYYGHWEGEIVDDAPVHEMWLRLVINQDKQIVDVEAAMDHTPFPRCTDVSGYYKRLIGLNIGAGLNKSVFELVGGTQGCTHVTGLIQIMATTLFQSMASEAQRILANPDGKSPEALMQERVSKISAAFANSAEPGYPLLNTCYSHASNSPVVQKLAPSFHIPDAEN